MAQLRFHDVGCLAARVLPLLGPLAQFLGRLLPQAFVDRRTESHIDEHGGALATRSLVAQDLGQFAHQYIAIARVFAGDANPRARARISARRKAATFQAAPPPQTGGSSGRLISSTLRVR